jgi:hypothetical protein
MNRFSHSHIFQEVQRIGWKELGLTVFHTKYLGMAVQVVQYSDPLQLPGIITKHSDMWK